MRFAGTDGSERNIPTPERRRRGRPSTELPDAKAELYRLWLHLLSRGRWDDQACQVVRYDPKSLAKLFRVHPSTITRGIAWARKERLEWEMAARRTSSPRDD